MSIEASQGTFSIHGGEEDPKLVRVGPEISLKELGDPDSHDVIHQFLMDDGSQIFVLYQDVLSSELQYINPALYDSVISSMLEAGTNEDGGSPWDTVVSEEFVNYGNIVDYLKYMEEDSTPAQHEFYLWQASNYVEELWNDVTNG
jgi:hypothetical protein